jgi:transcription elongation factor Elf1
MPEHYLPTHCADCGHKFSIRPSAAMKCGINSGHATCPNCKEFLHVEALEGGAWTEKWNDYLARTNPAANSH